LKKKKRPGNLGVDQIVIIGESALVGAIAGVITLAYRICLEYAGTWLSTILSFAKGHPLRMAGWFAALALMALVVSRLVKYEPLISGSGIPQVEGEMIGTIKQNWKRIMPTKFIGGFICMLGGMALGREGPSIQLGAMAGKGVSRILGRKRTEEKFLLTCGAGAGLATAFHAPLAGAMFAIEEIHKGFSVIAILSVMTSSLTSDYICTYVLGMQPVFNFQGSAQLEPKYYWLLIILGLILGIAGVFYNWFTLKVQSLYDKAKNLDPFFKLLVPFMLCGVLGFIMPQTLGGGHSLIESLCAENMELTIVFVILIIRLILGAVCFGSGAPGGIFLPMLVLGAFIGGAFAKTVFIFSDLDPALLTNFVTLAMAGFLTASVRAPLTGIILIFEMTGSANQFLSLSIVSLFAYIVPTLLKSKPIYDSLLSRILKKRDKAVDKNSVRIAKGEKVLSYFNVHHGSKLDGRRVMDINWPENMLLVSIERGSEDIIPKGRTKLLTGDTIVVMHDEAHERIIRREMSRLDI
jgi:H+/Cl- antiporter ClcA